MSRICHAIVLLGLAAPALAFDNVQIKATLRDPSFKNFSPAGVAVDAQGRAWVVDSANHDIVLFSAAGNVEKHIGRRGSGPGEFQEPHGIALDNTGAAYVADRGNRRIDVFSPDGEFVRSFGEKGGGLGQFHDPWTIAVSRDGVVIVGEKDAPRLQLFSKDGIYLYGFDAGAPVDALAVDAAGHLYIGHIKLKQIQSYSAAGQWKKSFTGAEPGVKPFDEPAHIAVDDAGTLVIADAATRQIREMDSSGHTLGLFGRRGSDDGQFRTMNGIAIAGDAVYIADEKNHRVTVLALSRPNPPAAQSPMPAMRFSVSLEPPLALEADRLSWNNGVLQALSVSKAQITRMDLASKTTTQIDLKASAGIKTPSGLTTAPTSGALFVSDAANHRVVKLDKQGKVLLEFGRKSQADLSRPMGLACSVPGVLFVADPSNSRFSSFNHQALFLSAGGDKGQGPGQLKTPVALAWDLTRLYVVDAGNHKVAAFNATGRFLQEFGLLGPETLVDPQDIAVDREGDVYVLDAARGRIVVYDGKGVYLGGFGRPGAGPGMLNRPRAIAITDTGDLFVAEEGRTQVFHVVLLPPTPTGLALTPGEGFIALKWDAVPTRFPARYVVLRSTTSGAMEKWKDTVQTSATDDTLMPNTTYAYQIEALSIDGATSIPSAPVSAMAKAMTSGPRLEIASAHIDDVFSAYYKYYGRMPFGHVVVRNNGQGPVQKIKLSFAIQGYMDFPTEVEIPELHFQETKDLPIQATFNNRILEVAETTPIQAQLKLTYYSGDLPFSVERNMPFKLYSRNTIRWDDKNRLAAFVTPNDPPVIDFARGIAVPFAEAHRGAPLPQPILTAWSLFEGLGTFGITYAPRPNNPYAQVSLDVNTVDTMQFARETLARKSGDCADVVALLASALESMTVTTAALDVPGHLFLMFDTGETDQAALGFPEDRVVLYAGTYWIPLEATMLGQPFQAAWKQGAEEYRRWSAQGKLSPIDIHTAWRTYEPATLPSAGAATFPPPAREAIEAKFLADWKSLVELRWQTSLAAAQAESAANPASGKPWLRMGLLAVEFKRYDEAKTYLAKARKDPATEAAAINNLGNLAFLTPDVDTAASLYQEAHVRDPKDGQILLNLARAYLKKGNRPKAAEAFGEAMKLEPALHDKYPDVTVLAP